MFVGCGSRLALVSVCASSVELLDCRHTAGVEDVLFSFLVLSPDCLDISLLLEGLLLMESLLKEGRGLWEQRHSWPFIFSCSVTFWLEDDVFILSNNKIFI